MALEIDFEESTEDVFYQCATADVAKKTFVPNKKLVNNGPQKQPMTAAIFLNSSASGVERKSECI